MSKILLYSAVVVSGAAVLIIEILGARLLGPYFGVSLTVWSALIGVTLAALSCGYALGGRWADADPAPTRFAALFLTGGALTLLLPLIQRPVITLVAGLGLRAGSLAGAMVLMFPPLLVLGMVTPFAVRLNTARLDQVGRAAGNLFAVSTLASVFAAVATGFWLIPILGVRRLLVATGAMLLGMGLALVVRTRTKSLALLAVPAFVALGLAGASRPQPAPQQGLLAVTPSPYGEIRVLDHKGMRFMLIDGSSHTMVDPTTFASDFPYVNVLQIGREFLPQPGRMLLVGLGGGSVAKSYAKAGWRVDAVEIDPVVARYAVRWFGLKADEATVYLANGRRFLEEQDPGTYDLIVMDAFGGSSIPFHLVTREVFDLVRSRLKPEGLFAMNAEAVGWHHPLIESLAATLQSVFPHVQVLPMVEPPDKLGNLVLLAADRTLELGRELGQPGSRWSGQYDLVHAWANRFGPTPGRGRVLTDDHNSVDVWSDAINLVARKDLHKYFADTEMAW